MSKIVNGQTGAILVRVIKRSSPVQGFSITNIFECTNDAAAESCYIDQITAGASVVWTDGAKPTIEATFGGDPDQAEVPQDEYTLDVNTVPKDILDSDLEVVAALNETNRDELRRYMQDPSAYKNEGSQFSSTVAGGSPSDASWVAATTLWTLIQNGLRHHQVDQPVFRFSRFASRLYNVPFSYRNVNKLLTTGQMKADSHAPIDFLIRIDEIVAEFSDPIRTDGLSVKYAWKKKSPRLNGSGRNKRRVDQEYEYGLWSTVQYRDAT